MLTEYDGFSKKQALDASKPHWGAAIGAAVAIGTTALQQSAQARRQREQNAAAQQEKSAALASTPSSSVGPESFAVGDHSGLEQMLQAAQSVGPPTSQVPPGKVTSGGGGGFSLESMAQVLLGQGGKFAQNALQDQPSSEPNSVSATGTSGGENDWMKIMQQLLGGGGGF